MTKGRMSAERPDAVVWIEHDRAVIIERQPGRWAAVEWMDRRPSEAEEAFETRAIETIEDLERVTVTGPAYARVAFERAYVAATHRPDRLVDVEPTTWPSNTSHRGKI